MSKRKVLFLIESLSGGGAEKVLITLLNHIDYRMFDITLCSIVNVGKYIDKIPSTVHYTYILPNPSTLSKFGLILYKIKYQLVYKILPLNWVYHFFIPHHHNVEVAFVEGFSTKLLSYSTNTKAKRIAWLHSNPDKHHWTTSLYKNLVEEENVYNCYHQIVTVAKSVERSFYKIFSDVYTPVTTIYNPIDSKDIFNKSALKVTLPSKKHILRIVSVGRLSYAKSYDRLLRIFKRLRDEGYRFELWLIGDGEDKTKLLAYINNHNLVESITLWGFKENPYVYVKHCDLFVCSSISEGYSTAVTESLILGVPVITTDCSGMKELLGDNEYGIITENTEEALYIGLKRLLERPEIIEQYRLKAIERGKDFSIDALVKPIENLFLS